MTGAFATLASLAADAGMTLDDYLLHARKAYVEEQLKRTKGNRTAAARALGTHRNTLLRSIHELGLPQKKGPWSKNNAHFGRGTKKEVA